jgi:hypothetical protein
LFVHTLSFDVFLYINACGETSAILSGRFPSNEDTACYVTLTAS